MSVEFLLQRPQWFFIKMNNSPRLSSSRKAVIWVVLLLLFVVGIYYLLGRTPPAPEQVMRRGWEWSEPRPCVWCRSKKVKKLRCASAFHWHCDANEHGGRAQSGGRGVRQDLYSLKGLK